MTPTASRLSGRAVIDGLKSAGVDFVLSVPDISTSEGLLRPISVEPGLRLVRVCKEDEGVSVCAALSFSERRAVLLMQQTGLMDSLNAVRAIGIDYKNPVCMLVGLLGKEPGAKPADSQCYGVRVIEPVLDAMGIRHLCMYSDADIAAGMMAIDRAYSTNAPLVILFGNNPQ